MTTYYRAEGSDTWHWCKKCLNFPETHSETSKTEPTEGKLCNQCNSRTKTGNC